MLKLKDLLLEISDAEYFIQHHRLWKDILKEELYTWILKNFYNKRRPMLAVEKPFKKNPSAIRKLVKNKVNDVWKAANTILTIRKTGIKRNDVEYKLWEKILKTQLEGTIEEYLNKIEKRDPNGGEYHRWMGKRHKLMSDFEKRLHGHLVDFFNAPMFMST